MGVSVTQPYRVLGWLLGGLGLATAMVGFFGFHSLPIVYTGAAVAVLGGIAYIISTSDTDVTTSLNRLFRDFGVRNTVAMVREYDLQGRAVYLPLPGGRGVRTFVPSEDEADVGWLAAAPLNVRVFSPPETPNRLAAAVVTPGEISLERRIIRNRIPPNTLDDEMAGLLVGELNLLGAVNVDVADGTVMVRVTGLREQLGEIPIDDCLGTVVSSVAAAVTCNVLRRPVRVREESYTDHSGLVALELLE